MFVLKKIQRLVSQNTVLMEPYLTGQDVTVMPPMHAGYAGYGVISVLLRWYTLISILYKHQTTTQYIWHPRSLIYLNWKFALPIGGYQQQRYICRSVLWCSIINWPSIKRLPSRFDILSNKLSLICIFDRPIAVTLEYIQRANIS